MNIQSTCILLSIICLAASDKSYGESLGRLFFSPAERLQIDRERRTPTRVEPPPRLDGFITRSDGPPTLFLDGRARPASPRQIHPQDATVSITTSGGRTQRLQVGSPYLTPRP